MCYSYVKLVNIVSLVQLALLVCLGLSYREIIRLNHEGAQVLNVYYNMHLGAIRLAIATVHTYLRSST